LAAGSAALLVSAGRCLGVPRRCVDVAGGRRDAGRSPRAVRRRDAGRRRLLPCHGYEVPGTGFQGIPTLRCFFGRGAREGAGVVEIEEIASGLDRAVGTVLIAGDRVVEPTSMTVTDGALVAASLNQAVTFHPACE
ncbi:MAG TPA: hypothetical protein RMF84_00890, partial [Polyangiaceae bacterium LLY-WYZ-14_1]|nr:hypothetical protein [Polyangiaceae bacterium LLY-WYZ-14_1]